MPVLETWADLQAEMAGQGWYFGVRQSLAASGATPRECEVVWELLKGQSVCEIASALGVADQTVKNHLGNLYERFGVHDRLQLALRLLGVMPSIADPTSRR